MDKSQKVVIGFSCSEDFSSMEKVRDKTRICDQCNKNVIDYSKEIKLPKLVGGCGVFRRDQVRFLEQTSIIPSILKPISLAALFGLALTPAVSSAQKTDLKVDSQEIVQQKPIVISGVLRDKDDGEALPFVNVLVREGMEFIAGASTSFDGSFEIVLDSNIQDLTGLFLITSYVGYTKSEIDLSDKKREMLLDIKVELSGNGIGCSLITGIVIRKPMESNIHGTTIDMDDWKMR